MIQEFDKLNALTTYKYFQAMNLTATQLQQRIRFADEFEDILLLVFGIIQLSDANSLLIGIPIDERIATAESFLSDDKIANAIAEASHRLFSTSVEEVRSTCRKIVTASLDRLGEVYKQNSPIEFEQYKEKLLKDIVDKAIDEFNKSWNTSSERATNVAREQAQTVLNTIDYETAIKRGFKRKRWKDIVDERERATHLEIGDKTVPIDEYFHVGNCYMLYPHDYINGTPEELANCRCSIEYIN